MDIPKRPMFNFYGKHVRLMSWFDWFFLIFFQEFAFLEDGHVFRYKIAFGKVYMLGVEKIS